MLTEIVIFERFDGKAFFSGINIFSNLHIDIKHGLNCALGFELNSVAVELGFFSSLLGWEIPFSHILY